MKMTIAVACILVGGAGALMNALGIGESDLDALLYVGCFFLVLAFIGIVSNRIQLRATRTRGDGPLAEPKSPPDKSGGER